MLFVALDGNIGPHRIEQPFPKPRQVAFDHATKFVVVPDKGCDRVLVYTQTGGPNMAAAGVGLTFRLDPSPY
jgi:6-phosphogluconolactonase (cycloisomerase 2 family)